MPESLSRPYSKGLGRRDLKLACDPASCLHSLDYFSGPTSLSGSRTSPEDRRYDILIENEIQFQLELGKLVNALEGIVRGNWLESARWAL